MTYAFNLEWDELPEDLRSEKIDEYIRANMAEYIDSSDEDADEFEHMEEAVANQTNRDDAENSIRARFPIYF